MAKPTKYATPICAVLTVIAFVGIVLGIIFHNALVAIILLLPAVIYEVYRTEGRSTKTSSVLMLLVLIALLVLIIFKINLNLAEYLGSTEGYIGGYLVPLGDIKILAPTIMAVLSVVLFVRTRGVYTKWLAVIVFVSAFAIVYIIDPNIFQQLLKFGVEEGMEQIS